jgi:hypothetical protein
VGTAVFGLPAPQSHTWEDTRSLSPSGDEWLPSNITETAVVDKLAEKEDHAGHGHHGHAH